MKGFTCKCSNLQEVDDHLSSNNISLIILDLMLPDGSGLDFCKTLKSSNIYKNIPIIIVTAKGMKLIKWLVLSLVQMIM